MTSREALFTLADAYLDGSITAESLAELERLLCADAEACKLFWVAVHHDIQLREFPFADKKIKTAITPSPEKIPDQRMKGGKHQHWWRQARPLVAACAALLLVIMSVLLWPSSATGPFAHIVAVHAPMGESGTVEHVNGQQEPIRADMHIRTGDHIAVATGAALEIQFSHEHTVLGLGSETTLAIKDSPTGAHLQLEKGTLTAEVAKQAGSRQLIVSTEQAQVKVVGTRFVVNAVEQRTSVEVDEGVVQVLNASNSATESISAGQSVVAENGKALSLTHVPSLSWSDRRPFGVELMCRHTSGWSENPRGWLNDEKLDVTTTDGKRAFAEKIMKRIDKNITNLRAANAQGLIFWDLEGLEHDVGYIGDPRQIATLAPEMDTVVDELFARVRAAGFAVGMTVRTERAERGADGKITFRRIDDPVREIQAKIAYAQKRWGATLFIIIGNGGDAMAMSTITRRIGATLPNTLLIPSGSDDDTYKWGAPLYNPQQASGPSRANEVRKNTPQAFTVYAPLEPTYRQQEHATLVQNVAAGDVLTFRSWISGNEVDTIITIYREAHNK